MNFYDQMEAWLEDYPDATPREAWRAGYLQCVENWVRGTTDVKRRKKPLNDTKKKG